MIDFVNDHVLGVEQLAERLGVHPVTVRRWFHRGLDPAMLGGAIFTTPLNEG